MKRVIFIGLVLSLGVASATAQTTRERARTVLNSPAVPTVAEKAPLDYFGLADGTVVKLKLKRELTSKAVREADKVELEVVEAISTDGIVVVPLGALAEATVIDAQAARRMGRTGRIGIRLDWVKSAADKPLALRAMHARADGSEAKTVAENAYLVGVFFFPAAPFMLLKKGHEMTIPVGTLVTAFIDGNLKLERSDFKP